MSNWLVLTRRAALGCLALCLFAVAPAVADAVEVNVLESTPDRVVLHYRFDVPTLQTVEVEGEKLAEIRLGKEPVTKVVGAPELPIVCRSIILPDTGTASVNVLRASYDEMQEVGVVPSKGFILRTVDPAEVPYTFGIEYSKNAFFPDTDVTLRAPYILRDFRGAVVEVHPVQYNPVTRRLLACRDMVLEVVSQPGNGVNTLSGRSRDAIDPSFRTIYKHHFLNSREVLQRYSPLDEDGDLLIICHDAWLPNMQAFVNHKISRGIPTTLVGVSTIGNNHTAIKNYIQNYYNSNDLAFVLLVGDAAQVATPSASGGASDPTYSKLAGGDNYPDIMVGRFSAETAAQVDTQVQRTITYETTPAQSQAWFWKGIGVASAQGAGIGDEGQADWVHMNEIRQWLLGYGYTEVDQIYDTNGGNATMVTNALNAGRGIINYCGHGSTTSWGTTGFSNSHINALLNDNMLPFIVSVACVNGNFTNTTCFAEAWMRATNGATGEPTGAIGIYASSINQSWAPPMEGQDEFNLLLVAEAYVSYGTLCYAGSCSMMDDYGSGGVSMFDTWHVFGDPTVAVGIALPVPPTANSGNAMAPTNAPVTITLNATDDGLPDPPAALTYIITALPGHGYLRDPQAGRIHSVPYALANGGNQVEYLPGYWNTAPDSFMFKANDGGVPPEGGDSNEATIFVTIDAPLPVKVHAFNFESAPGWTTEGMWAFGQPTGEGTWCGDPTGGHTGNNVYGFNLNGDYTNYMSDYYLTSDAIDCADLLKAELRFHRWLGVEAADVASIDISTDRATWTRIYQNNVTIADDAWTPVAYDISTVADGEATVFIRWGMGPTDGSFTMPGWNIDDVEIWAIAPPSGCYGDADCSGTVDFADIDYFISALGGEMAWANYYLDRHDWTWPTCPYKVNDLNGGGVDFTDIEPFVQQLGQPCVPVN
jgi:hypothetical protein